MAVVLSIPVCEPWSLTASAWRGARLGIRFVGGFIRIPPLVLVLRDRRELLFAVVMWMPLCPETRLSSHDERMGRFAHKIDRPIVMLLCGQWFDSHVEAFVGLQCVTNDDRVVPLLLVSIL